MDQDLMDQNLAEMPLKEDMSGEDDDAPDTVPVPRSLVPHLSQTAILLDIDGTLLDLAPTPREVWVPPGLAKTLHRLHQRTAGALALVSGRSLNDIDLIFAPEQFPAVGGHGAEMRVSADSESVATHAPPLDKELKRRLAAIARLSPGILLEDKGYSLALHYRLAPHAEKAIYEAVSLIRADLPNAPIEVLPGKCPTNRSRVGSRSSSVTMSRTNRCSPSCRTCAALPFRSAGAPRAWRDISTIPATFGNGWPICSTTKRTEPRIAAERCGHHSSITSRPNLVSFR
jgi:trehalose 6-phosphate phosphatase